MKKTEIINPNDKQYFPKLYEVSLYNYDHLFYGAYADCEQDALDVIVDHLAETGQTGYFVETEAEYTEDEIIYAGNSGTYPLLVEHVHIKQIN